MFTWLPRNYLSGIKTVVEASNGATKQMQGLHPLNLPCDVGTIQLHSVHMTFDKFVYAYTNFATCWIKVYKYTSCYMVGVIYSNYNCNFVVAENFCL